MHTATDPIKVYLQALNLKNVFDSGAGQEERTGGMHAL